MESFCVEAQIFPYITSNTTTISIPITSENIKFNTGKFNSGSGTIWAGFYSVIPIMVALIFSAMHLILSFLEVNYLRLYAENLCFTNLFCLMVPRW